LVRIFFNNPGIGVHGVLYSVPELEDLRNRAGVFEYVTGTERGSVNLTGGSQAERLEMLCSNPNYFSMLGATPQIGRLFDSQDFTPGYAPSVVISDSLWHSNFAANPNVLGRIYRRFRSQANTRRQGLPFGHGTFETGYDAPASTGAAHGLGCRDTPRFSR
jgi:hypothetical protein